ncbi:MAG: hypothetical protein ACRC20_13745 [Segniliparus sp.]
MKSALPRRESGARGEHPRPVTDLVLVLALAGSWLAAMLALRRIG